MGFRSALVGFHLPSFFPHDLPRLIPARVFAQCLLPPLLDLSYLHLLGLVRFSLLSTATLAINLLPSTRPALSMLYAHHRHNSRNAYTSIYPRNKGLLVGIVLRPRKPYFSGLEVGQTTLDCFSPSPPVHLDRVAAALPSLQELRSMYAGQLELSRGWRPYAHLCTSSSPERAGRPPSCLWSSSTGRSVASSGSS